MNKLTYAKVLQSGYEKERTFAVNSTIKDISTVMNKKIYTASKVIPNLSDISNDLLKSEQISSLPMLSLPPPLCTDPSISKNASNITVKSGCESDVCLDRYDQKFLSILEDLHCLLNTVQSQSQISAPSVYMEQCKLSGSFVSDKVFNLNFLLIVK